MGNAATIEAQQKQRMQQQTMRPAIGHWVSDFKTGYRWATPPIQSTPSVRKVPFGQTVPGFEKNAVIGQLNINVIYAPNSMFKPKEPGQIWGPYAKQFTKSVLGQNVFTPPESIDGIPLLCPCRRIQEYVRDDKGGRKLNALYALLAGNTPPACYDDNETIMEPNGGMNFFVVIRHPDFYNFMQSSSGSMGILEQQFTGPRVTGILPSLFAVQQLKQAKTPGQALSPIATIARSIISGGRKRIRKNRHRRKTRKCSRQLRLSLHFSPRESA
jgi:hypothetical protein